jgi:putative endonuclease
MYYVYIFKCADDSFYTGFTSDIKRRMHQHRMGTSVSTKYRLPVRVVFCGCFFDRDVAVCFEQYLKSHSGRAFRNKRLVNG